MHKNNLSLRESISEYTSDNSHIPRTREHQFHLKNSRPISIDYLEPNTASVGSVYTNPFEAASQKENNYTKKYSQSRDFNVTNVTRDSGHATRSSVSKSYGQHSQKYQHRLGGTLHDRDCNNNNISRGNPFHRKTEPTNSLSLHPEVGSIKEFQRNCIVHNEAELRQRQNLLNAVNQLQINTDQNQDEEFQRCQASFNDEYSYDKYARDLFNRAKDKEKEMMMTRNPNISKEDYLRRDQKNAATFTSPYHHRESLIDRDSNGLKNFHSRGNRDHKSIDFGSLCTTNMLSSDYDTNYGLSYHRNSIGNQNNNNHHPHNNRVSSHKSYETDNRFLSVESIESPFQSNHNNRISGKTFPNRLTDRSCSVMNPPPASTMSLLKSSISAQNYNNNNNNNNDHHLNFNRNANHYNSNNSFPRLESNGSATTGGKTKTSRTKSMPISVLGVSLSAHELGHSNQSALKNMNGHNNHMVFTHNQHITGPNGFRKGIRSSFSVNSGGNHHNIGGQRLPPLNMCRTRSLFKGIKFKKFPRMLKNKLKF